VDAFRPVGSRLSFEARVRARFGRHRKPGTLNVGDAANVSRASESDRKQALVTIRERRGEGQTRHETHSGRCARISRTARGSLEGTPHARQNDPVSDPSRLASMRHAEPSRNSLHSAPSHLENAVAVLLASRLTAGSVHRVWTTCGHPPRSGQREGRGRSAQFL
jgi:hypothetical protein